MTHKGFAIIIANKYGGRPDVIGPFDTFDEALQSAYEELVEDPAPETGPELMAWYYEYENLWIGKLRSPASLRRKG